MEKEVTIELKTTLDTREADEKIEKLQHAVNDIVDKLKLANALLDELANKIKG